MGQAPRWNNDDLTDNDNDHSDGVALILDVEAAEKHTRKSLNMSLVDYAKDTGRNDEEYDEAVLQRHMNPLDQKVGRLVMLILIESKQRFRAHCKHNILSAII